MEKKREKGKGDGWREEGGKRDSKSKHTLSEKLSNRSFFNSWTEILAFFGKCSSSLIHSLLPPFCKEI